MHSSIPVLFMAGIMAAAPAGMAQSSFGPEISAEDFQQHLWALRSPGFASAGDTAFAGRYMEVYLQTQFERLGLDTREIDCGGKIRGLMALLPGIGPDGRPVLYLADSEKPHEAAAILEIAERFVTERPRPAHDVYFLFSTVAAGKLTACTAFRQTARIIQPTGMQARDAGELVTDLIELQRQGK